MSIHFIIILFLSLLVLIYGFIMPRYLISILYIILVMYLAPPFNGDIGFSKLSISFGSVNVYPHDILLVVIVFIIVKLIYSDPKIFLSQIKTKASFLMILYLSWHIFRGMHGIMFLNLPIDRALRLISSKFFSIFIILIPLIYYNSSLKEKKKIFPSKTIFWSGIAIPVFGLVNMALHPKGIIITSSGTFRYLTGSANIFLGYSLIVAYLNLINGDTKKLLLRLLYISWLFFGMLLTQHRSIIIALLSILLVDAFLFSHFESFIRKTFCSVFSIVLFILIFNAFQFNPNSFSQQVYKRFSDTFNSKNATTVGRLQIWENSSDIIKIHPFIGEGLKLHYVKHGTKLLVSHPHNMVVNIFISEGIIGLLINGALIMWCMLGSYRLSKSEEGFNSYILLLFFIYFIVYSMFNTTYTSTLSSELFYLSLGILALFQVKDPNIEVSK